MNCDVEILAAMIREGVDGKTCIKYRDGKLTHKEAVDELVAQRERNADADSK